MNINWVGFRNSPKPPADAEKLQVKYSLDLPTALPEVIPLFTTAAGLSRWLAPVANLDARQGGQIFFADQTTAGGAFATLDIPKCIVIVTEQLGGLDARFREVRAAGEPASRLELTVTKFVSAQDAPEWRQSVSATVTRLTTVCQEVLR